VEWPERNVAVAFGIRFAILFAVTLLPVPWLADAYTTVLGRGTNAFLSVFDGPSRVAVRFEPPAHIEAHGSWKADLLLEDRQTGLSTRTRLDARSFSYRPIATFLALAAASFRRGWRRNAIVWGGGLALMGIATTFLSALPLLSLFGAAGGLGVVPGLVVRTLYQALATPVMMYAVAVLVWWIVMSLASAGERARLVAAAS
jgi:hypothetical protein